MRTVLSTHGLRPEHELTEQSLLTANPPALLREPEELTDPVLRILLERARDGSRPGDRADDHVVCLAIEGGGMRGAVSAGMCIVLEAAGLAGAFDRIYGVSAGALNGWGTAVGQAALGATLYQDAASRRVINRMRPLIGRPVIDFDVLFETLITTRKPLSFEALASRPELRILAASLETLSLRVLADFATVEELMLAVRASAALPGLDGTPPVFGEERMTDGGLLEPIPFRSALEEGATHVLVLRTRPARYRKPRITGLGDSFAFRDEPELAELIKAQPAVYNHAATELERHAGGLEPDANLRQIVIPSGTRVVGRLGTDGQRVSDALRLGAKAMASAILTEPIDLCWQPVIYRTAG